MKQTSGFIKSTLTLFSGSALSNIIALTLIPFYTSAYLPEVIGIFFVFSAITIILSSIVTLQSHNTIILSKNTRKIYANTTYSFFVSLILSVLTFIPIVLVYLNCNLLPIRVQTDYIFLIPLGALLVSIQLSLENYYTAFERYKNISKSRMIRVLVMAFIQIVFFSNGASTLIWGYLAGYLASNIYLFSIAGIKVRKSFFTNQSINQFIKTHKQIFTYNTGIVTILQFSQNLPTIALAYLFGNDVAGVFGMAHRILATPLSLISQSVSQVYYKSISNRFNHSSLLAPFTKRVAINLFLILVIPTLVLIAFANQFFNLFNSQWENGGIVLILIAPWVFMQSFNMPFTNLFTVLRIQKQIFSIYILLLLQRVSSILVPFYIFKNQYSVLISISLLSVLYYMYYYRYILSKAQKADELLTQNLKNKTVPITYWDNIEPGINSYFKLHRLFSPTAIWIMGKKEKILFIFKKIQSASDLILTAKQKVLKVNFEKGKLGPKPGMQFIIPLYKKSNKINFTYKLFIPNHFNFTEGGKLPGLAGGKIMSGGSKPNGQNGWSARMMHLKEGKICQYLYHANMKSIFGEIHLISLNGIPQVLPKNEWITISQTVQINELGKTNGAVFCSINGIKMDSVTNLYFSNNKDLKIDKIFFSCFYGGDTLNYAPKNNCYLQFCDFTIHYY